jgi:hypothetical protein
VILVVGLPWPLEHKSHPHMNVGRPPFQEPYGSSGVHAGEYYIVTVRLLWPHSGDARGRKFRPLGYAHSTTMYRPISSRSLTIYTHTDLLAPGFKMTTYHCNRCYNLLCVLLPVAYPKVRAQKNPGSLCWCRQGVFAVHTHTRNKDEFAIPWYHNGICPACLEETERGRAANYRRARMGSQLDHTTTSESKLPWGKIALDTPKRMGLV